MLVHAYDKNREIVAVNLSIEQIVAESIDPWRLDLFDKEPIKLVVGGRKTPLNFRRLSDVSFFYREEGKTSSKDGRVFYCLHDGENTICVSQSLLGSEPLERCPESFAFHLTRYLTKLCRPITEYASCPYPASSVVINGNRARIYSEQGSIKGATTKPTFVGEMHNHLQHPVPLPDYMNRILAVLSDAQPCIFGAGVAKAMLGERVTSVRLVIPPENIPNARSALRVAWIKTEWKEGSNRCEFKHRGCKYIVGISDRLTIDECLREWPSTELRIYRPNLVEGTRMQFHEMAQLQIAMDRFRRAIRKEVDKYLAEEAAAAIPDSVMELFRQRCATELIINKRYHRR